ncbi:MAG: hypothetical protein HYR76_02980 [Ignavibacteria bacterium]|nr:hypothetical protein [Ignavibacteria bacterium]
MVDFKRSFCRRKYTNYYRENQIATSNIALRIEPLPNVRRHHIDGTFGIFTVREKKEKATLQA